MNEIIITSNSCAGDYWAHRCSVSRVSLTVALACSTPVLLASYGKRPSPIFVPSFLFRLVDCDAKKSSTSPKPGTFWMPFAPTAK